MAISGRLLIVSLEMQSGPGADLILIEVIARFNSTRLKGQLALLGFRLKLLTGMSARMAGVLFNGES